MFRSLHMKLVLIMVLLIVSLMTVVGAFLINSVSSFYLNDFYSQMQEVFADEDLTAEAVEELGRTLAAMENVEKAVRLSHVYHSFFYCDEGQESVEKDRETFPLFLRPLPILFSWRLSALRDRYIRS